MENYRLSAINFILLVSIFLLDIATEIGSYSLFFVSVFLFLFCVFGGLSHLINIITVDN